MHNLDHHHARSEESGIRRAVFALAIALVLAGSITVLLVGQSWAANPAEVDRDAGMTALGVMLFAGLALTRMMWRMTGRRLGAERPRRDRTYRG
ncbi:MAG: hypothetical protein AB7L41_14395 [Flavobacteriaceae bacterium]